MTLHLAFYRGTGRWGRWDDRLIRWATRGPFSHVEMLRVRPDPHPLGAVGRAISASRRDGGVRRRRIVFRHVRWLIVPLRPWCDPDTAWARACAEEGAPYDLRGIVLSQILALRRHDPARWFCSELIAHALDLAQPQTLSPTDLYHHVRDLNRAWERGRQWAAGGR